MTPMKPIDEALFAEMWNAGQSAFIIGPAVGIARQRVTFRAAKMGLAPRVKAAPPPAPQPRKMRSLSRPKADPKPAPEPTYHHGLSDAIKRARGSVQRLGKVATSYRVAYRDVLAMAGVTV